ncbi:alpha/beta hydrolase [Serratia sp. (in: enterobacteria)]|uniref:alpha/beta hydrolase n=1 Tax=Serratia sp. (in: enterobacteria) TaxID=616 RepID=UPI003989A17E
MPLDKQIALFLQQQTDAPAPSSLEALRAQTAVELQRLQGEPQPVQKITDFHIPVSGGQTIALRGYIPWNASENVAHPAMVFAHGGGWCLGSLDVYDVPCRALANATGRMILSVDYRLAPEYPFPVPLHDVYQALCWASEQAAQIGIDPLRIALGGDSAGGNLAAAAALMARERSGPTVEHQYLLYPALDSEMTMPSFTEYGEGYYLTQAIMGWCWANYLGQDTDPRESYASPWYASTLAGLPPATILVCEYDPLRDEGEHYAQRLQAAGVNVNCQRLPGMVHACMHMTGLAPKAQVLFTALEALP